MSTRTSGSTGAAKTEAAARRSPPVRRRRKKCIVDNCYRLELEVQSDSDIFQRDLHEERKKDQLRVFEQNICLFIKRSRLWTSDSIS